MRLKKLSVLLEGGSNSVKAPFFTILYHIMTHVGNDFLLLPKLVFSMGIGTLVNSFRLFESHQPD